MLIHLHLSPHSVFELDCAIDKYFLLILDAIKNIIAFFWQCSLQVHEDVLDCRGLQIYNQLSSASTFSYFSFLSSVVFPLLSIRRWYNVDIILYHTLFSLITQSPYMDNMRSLPILLNLFMHLSVPNSSIQAECMNLHDAAPDHSTQSKMQFRGTQHPQEAGIMCSINKWATNRRNPLQDTERRDILFFNDFLYEICF